MRAWLRKWYGDSCPFWTWPVTALGIAALIVVPLFMIHSDWGVLAMYSIQLGVAAGFVLQQWWRRSLKKKLRRCVTRWLRGLLVPQSGVSSSQNLCGAGGQSFRPMTKKWQEIFDQWPDHSLRIQATSKNSRAIYEALFFGYFGPLEAWCERNLSHEFYLWSDDVGISLIIPQEQDRIMWMLTWNDGLPSPTDVDSL